ncbi:MAG: hypothetical protein DDT39_00522 [Firmicutes bacterium]|nr:hypothetical protein [candidate division NPL-UPA2 bacterium]
MLSRRETAHTGYVHNDAVGMCFLRYGEMPGRPSWRTAWGDLGKVKLCGKVDMNCLRICTLLHGDAPDVLPIGDLTAQNPIPHKSQEPNNDPAPRQLAYIVGKRWRAV